MNGITLAFIVSETTGKLPGTILVGVAKQQHWSKDTLPTLKAAMESLIGPFKWRNLSVQNIEWLNEYVSGPSSDFFIQKHNENKYIRIILYPDHTFEIFKPATQETSDE